MQHMTLHDNTRQPNIRQDKTMQYKSRQDNAGQESTTPIKTI